MEILDLIQEKRYNYKRVTGDFPNLIIMHPELCRRLLDTFTMQVNYNPELENITVYGTKIKRSHDVGVYEIIVAKTLEI